METLVVVQHRNQYCGKPKAHSPARFGSSSSRDFRGIDCRTFHSGTGILPTPFRSYSSPLTEPPHPSSPKTPSPPVNSNSDRKTLSKITPKSAPIPINVGARDKMRPFSDEVPDGNLLFSELWAGPTYSNSPPPSSLPIPKFSVRPKRTVSLDLPSSSPEITMHPLAKSAPASPAREHSPSKRDLFCSTDSATKTLCRILNLNINDD
ncbi:leucine-rich repeat extensin-like protein 5 [Neltuma alba]|uniref:leucine-rich repeat extensin-like protein 5 n=1 Tax=Neltuma alba TaxID=207710 RepID=UPI0010A417EE|nr:leucine-rich repeat extensin-like protein 5 [Prosopis alba]